MKNDRRSAGTAAGTTRSALGFALARSQVSTNSGSCQMGDDGMDANEIWDKALAELRGVATKATFTQWISGTRAIALKDGQLILSAPGQLAKEWLESKQLTLLIERAVANVAERSLCVSYVLSPENESAGSNTRPGEDTQAAAEPSSEKELIESPLKPGDIEVKLIEDPLVPFIQVQKYAIKFWQPLIGAPAFAIWLVLRTMDKQNEGRGRSHRISVGKLALITGIARQTITGVARESSWQRGIFDTLNDEKLCKIVSEGVGRLSVYRAEVLNSVPYLSPVQVARLDPELQVDHDSFIHEFGGNELAVRWEQIALPSLVGG